MTALRSLSAIYIAAAGTYAVAMAMSAHPDWTHKAENAAVFLKIHGAETAVALDGRVLRPGWTIAQKDGVELGRRLVAALQTPPQHIARIAPPEPIAPISHVKSPVREASPQPATDANARAATAATPPSASSLRGAESEKTETATNAEKPPALALMPQASPAPAVPDAATSLASVPPPNPGEIAAVEQRLKDSLTPELLANFELFLYVSKADTGPWAQRMYVFRKQSSGDLTLAYNWPVSTGREQIEITPDGRRLTTFTPQGYYELDPDRSYTRYHSMEWGKPMPYAMFFNWIREGDRTGLAIHAATGDDIAQLGKRASAGCIHLSPDNARILFNLIRTQYRGLAPRFAIDRRTGTMSNEGIVLHDAAGHVQMADGYKVLVFIENYGGENVVAALF